MTVRTARVSLVFVCAVVLLACDSATAPTGLTPPDASVSPTELEVELVIGQRPGTRSALIEGRPATQTRRFVLGGRVVALNGMVTELFAQLRFVTPLSGSDGESDLVIPLDDLFQGVTNLGPDTALVFDNEEVEIDVAHPDGATSGTLRLDVTGRDQSGRVVFASAVVDVASADSSPVKGTCRVDDTTGCLLGDRFGATVDWRQVDGTDGRGRVVSGSRMEDGVSFFFVDPATADLSLQIRDDCAASGHFWTTVESTTTLEFTLAVWDTATGVTRDYVNPPGSADTLTDALAFATCP